MIDFFTSPWIYDNRIIRLLSFQIIGIAQMICSTMDLLFQNYVLQTGFCSTNLGVHSGEFHTCSTVTVTAGELHNFRLC